MKLGDFRCQRCRRKHCGSDHGTHCGDKVLDALCDDCWVEEVERRVHAYRLLVKGVGKLLKELGLSSRGLTAALEKDIVGSAEHSAVG